MASEAVRVAAQQAWDSFGQFTVPDLAQDDPQGRATLYIAGYMAGVFAAQERIAALEHRYDLMRQPCQCDPLGSGEEFCNGGCELRASIAELTDGLQFVAEGWHALMHPAFSFDECENGMCKYARALPDEAARRSREPMAG